MAPGARRSQRRTEALSRERIVEAAVELLDTAGESGLTFRVLTERLATGPGAIYWHVANKSELLGAATEAVVAAALAVGPAGAAASSAVSAAGSAGSGTGPAASAEPVGSTRSAVASAGPAPSAEAPGSPQDGIRAVALGLFDAIDAHPWLASQLSTQLSRSPWGSVAPRIFESIGRQVGALGVPESSWFSATSVLVHYILGAAGQNAANAAVGRTLGPGMDRARYLDAVSTAWEALDPDDYPFTRAVADQMRGHDDREQFLAGVDLVLAGSGVLRPPGAQAGAMPPA